MIKHNKYFSTTDTIVIILTFLLFTAALFLQGLTHDLLIEAGVLLVSIKLIRIGYKNSIAYSEILDELKKIRKDLGK
jgi:hypothetical protein